MPCYPRGAHRGAAGSLGTERPPQAAGGTELSPGFWGGVRSQPKTLGCFDLPFPLSVNGRQRKAPGPLSSLWVARARLRPWETSPPSPPATHPLLLFLPENLRHSDHPWVVLSPAIRSKQVRLKCFRRQTGSVPGSVLKFRMKTRARGLDAHRPDGRAALSPHPASPLQGEDAGGRASRSPRGWGSRDMVLGSQTDVGEHYSGAPGPPHTEEQP